MSENKLKRVRKSLDSIENGRHSEFTLSQCCDFIAWVAKWNKYPKVVWEPLCDQATRLLEEGYY